MPLVEAALLALDTAKAWAFPLSASLLCLYPAFVLLWTVAEGSLACKPSKRAAPPKEKANGAAAPEEASAKRARGERREVGGAKIHDHDAPHRISLLAMIFVALGGAAGAAAGQRAVGFLTAGPNPAVHGPRKTPVPADAADGRELQVEAATETAAPGGRFATVSAGLACVAAAALAARRAPWAGNAASGPAAAPAARHPGRVLRCAAGSGGAPTAVAEARAKTQLPAFVLPPGVQRHVAPAPTDVSLWHDIQLHVKTWLDEDTGLFHYVNEMPLASLQKFEVQPHVPHNAISEDPKGSSRLAAFGRPVPFNYGCFPQTYRDPEQVDELYGAPGDDDPLDILDLGSEVLGVGQVVQCRPLGAVCLIDEGQADWKILAVNTESGGPLADARSVEDVERIAPGRIKECLQWIDDFKHSKGGDQATLHFEIHDAGRALALIEKDHASWKRLVDAAGPDGTSRGHWVRSPGQPTPAQPTALRSGWVPSCAVPGQLLRTPSVLVGVSQAATLVHAQPPSRALTLRQDLQALVQPDAAEFRRSASP